MYYKIENQECEVYKQLFQLRTEELQILKDNEAFIEKNLGLDFDEYLGNVGQQNYYRTPTYFGFKFRDPSLVCLKTWKPDRDYPDFFVPNKKRVEGRRMNTLIKTGLKTSWFQKPWDILGVPHLSRFNWPFVEICGSTIIVFLDDKQEPTDPNVIEITKKEFHEHLNLLKL